MIRSDSFNIVQWYRFQAEYILSDWCIDWLNIILWAVFDRTLCLYSELQKGYYVDSDF